MSVPSHVLRDVVARRNVLAAESPRPPVVIDYEVLIDNAARYLLQAEQVHRVVLCLDTCPIPGKPLVCTRDAGHVGYHQSAGGTVWSWPADDVAWLGGP